MSKTKLHHMHYRKKEKASVQTICKLAYPVYLVLISVAVFGRVLLKCRCLKRNALKECCISVCYFSTQAVLFFYQLL